MLRLRLRTVAVRPGRGDPGLLHRTADRRRPRQDQAAAGRSGLAWLLTTKRCVSDSTFAAPIRAGTGGEMYGTVARIKLLPGKEASMMAETQGYPDLMIDGFIANSVYKADAGDDEYWLAVVFENKEKYFANADSPEQGERLQRLLALMEEEPQC